MPADNILKYFWIGLFLLYSAASSAVIPESEVVDAFIKQVRLKVPEYSEKQISANINLKPYQKKLFITATENWTLSVAIPKKSDISSVTYAKVVIYEGKERSESLRLKFSLSVYDEAYFAASNYPKESRLTKEMFYLKSVDLLRYSQKLVQKNYYFDDKYLICDVKPDQIMYEWMASPKPVVLVGETVTVTFYSEDVVLNLPAKVLQQGYLGDKILVQLTNGSRKTFKAMVVSEGKYEVRL